MEIGAPFRFEVDGIEHWSDQSHVWRTDFLKMANLPENAEIYVVGSLFRNPVLGPYISVANVKFTTEKR